VRPPAAVTLFDLKMDEFHLSALNEPVKNHISLLKISRKTMEAVSSGDDEACQWNHMFWCCEEQP